MVTSSKKISVYHLDDNFIDRQRVQTLLSEGILGYCFSVRSAQNSRIFWQNWHQTPVEIVLLDVNIDEERSGLELIAEIRARDNNTVIVLYSSLAEATTISAGLQLGIDDFLTKECAADEMRLRLVHSFLQRRKKLGRTGVSSRIVGETMAKVSEQLSLVHDSAVSTIHVYGESGTGKEVVAELIQESIHPQTMLKINCASIVPSLMASELFGHCRGAFSAANTDRLGYLEQATGGWLFLDEVACLSKEMQAALLRVLESNELVRVGESIVRQVEVKILSASNVPLARLVDEGQFRLDLWQRLQELELVLPPLRERHQEIAPLIKHFLKTMRGGPYRITREAEQILQQYDWRQGNVRELRNCLRSMSAHHLDGLLTPVTIPERVWRASNRPLPTVTIDNFFANPRPFVELQSQLMLACLRSHCQHYGRTSLTTFAKNFHLHPSTASRKVKRLLETGLLSTEQLGQYLLAGN